ncbi:MAG TPA: hypothetical protein VGO60_03505, partial [Iamia sp.]|nr:hypothetical protein [Iamia sp.]
MTDDDLTRDLEAWAAATDPATDPIVPSELADTDVPPLRRPGRSTRVLAVAAAVVVLLGLAAAVVVTRRHDGEAGVVTDDGGTEAPIGPRTQIVVETPKGAPYQERDVRQRYALHGPCGRRAVEACAAELAPIDEGPLRHGTSLIVDQALEPGTWALVLEVYLCGSAGCLSTDATGAPGQTTTGSSCTTVIEAVDRPTVVARMLTYGGNAETSCESDDTGAVPALDVPPAWS